MEEKAILLRLRGELRVYYEEQKERLKEPKDSKVLRALLREHKKIIEMKY
jgi:hypothetical protein